MKTHHLWWEWCNEKDASLLGIGMDLAWEEVEGTSKVVIVSFLYFIPWVSGLCNYFNIVSGVQLDRRNLLTSTSIYTVSEIVNVNLLRVRRLGTSGVSWEEHRIYPELDLGRRCRYNSGRLRRGQQARKAYVRFDSREGILLWGLASTVSCACFYTCPF